MRSGYVAAFSICALLVVSVVLSMLLGLLFIHPLIALAVFLLFAGVATLLALVPDDFAMYGTLATLISAAAMIGVCTSWTERDNAYADERGEIRSNVTREIPLGTPEPEALATLKRLGAYTARSAEREEYDCSFFCDALESDERFAIGYFSEVFNPGWVCSEGDYIAILVVDRGTVADIRFESTLGGCL